MLRRFNFGLRMLFDSPFLYLHAFRDAGRRLRTGFFAYRLRAGSCQFAAQRMDLIGELPVLLLELVEAFKDLPQCHGIFLAGLRESARTAYQQTENDGAKPFMEIAKVRNVHREAAPVFAVLGPGRKA